MNKKYFQIVPANAADAAALYWILTHKTFYPEATSTPALPVSVDPTFDYRQLFKLVYFNTDGSAVVYTRSEYTVMEFGTNVVPTADWTGRYNLGSAPTIVALPNYTQQLNGHNTQTDIGTFLSYDYQLSNNL